MKRKQKARQSLTLLAPSSLVVWSAHIFHISISGKHTHTHIPLLAEAGRCRQSGKQAGRQAGGDGGGGSAFHLSLTLSLSSHSLTVHASNAPVMPRLGGRCCNEKLTDVWQSRLQSTAAVAVVVVAAAADDSRSLSDAESKDTLPSSSLFSTVTLLPSLLTSFAAPAAGTCWHSLLVLSDRLLSLSVSISGCPA